MRCSSLRSTLSLGVALWMLAGAAFVQATVMPQTYAVLPGQVVHVCSFTCSLNPIEGTLTSMSTSMRASPRSWTSTS